MPPNQSKFHASGAVLGGRFLAQAPHLLPPPGPLSSMAHLKRRPLLATRLPWAVMAKDANQRCEASYSEAERSLRPTGVCDFKVPVCKPTSGARVYTSLPEIGRRRSAE